MPFSLAVENIKNHHNIGTLFRSCYNFDASLIIVIGKRYKPQSSDTFATHKKIPLLQMQTWDDYVKSTVYSWIHIGVEICNEATNIHNFQHPQNCVYLLGPEDGSLSSKAKNICKEIIYIPTKSCLNVAMAGTVVMYDRNLKMQGKQDVSN